MAPASRDTSSMKSFDATFSLEPLTAAPLYLDHLSCCITWDLLSKVRKEETALKSYLGIIPRGAGAEGQMCSELESPRAQDAARGPQGLSSSHLGRILPLRPSTVLGPQHRWGDSVRGASLQNPLEGHPLARSKDQRATSRVDKNSVGSDSTSGLGGQGQCLGGGASIRHERING